MYSGVINYDQIDLLVFLVRNSLCDGALLPTGSSFGRPRPEGETFNFQVPNLLVGL